MMDDTVRGAVPFLLEADPGARFCLYHAPQTEVPRGAIVYVPPFAEELNKCRRMAALQSRRLAHAGYAVVQPDLYGCGDSDGDFGDARWHLWLRDIEHVCHWLRDQGYGQPCLWGARLGALLALDFACAATTAPPALIMWQPALDGRRHINQFLRAGRAASMLAPGPAPSDARTTAQVAPLEVADCTLAPQLEVAGYALAPQLEVAGYALAPQLLQAIVGRDAGQLTPPCPVHWLEVDSAAESASGATPRLAATVAPASERQIARWRAAGVAVTARAVCGPSFWASTESVACPALLDATSALELP